MTDIKKTLDQLTSEDRIAIRDTAVEATNKALNALGLPEMAEKRIKATVGGGGYTPGQTFVLTGEVQIVPIEGTNNWFYGALTTTGEKITLKALIPQNPVGYKSDNSEILLQELEPNDEHPEEISPTYNDMATGKTAKTPKAIYDETLKTLTHGTKSDVELFGLIKTAIWSCKGLHLTYCGKVMRQIKAKRDFDFGNDHVKAGSRRVSDISVWLVKA